MTNANAKSRRPFQSAEETGPHGRHQNLHPNEAMNATLLLADADLDACQALADDLEGQGFSLLLAAGEADAMLLLQSNDVHLVVLDTRLRGSSGWEALPRVAALKPLLPMILTTCDLGQQARAAEAGADALVEKPVDFQALLRIIRVLLAQPTARRLQRVCTVEAFACYVPPSNASFLRALQARYTARLAMPELESVLKTLPAFRERRRELRREPHS